MPHHCAAYGCTNNSGKLSCLKKNISFHRFPLRDTNRLQLWVLSIKRKNFVPTQHSVLCSDHFSNRDFEYSGYGIKRTRRLRRDAIPNRYDYTIQGSKCKQSLDAQTPDYSNSESVKEDDGLSNNVPDPIVCYVQSSTRNTSMQTDADFVDGLLNEIKELRKENAELKKMLQFSKSCARVIINQNFLQKDPSGDRSANNVSGRIICYMKRVLNEKSVQTEHIALDGHTEDTEMMRDGNNELEQMLLQ